MHEVKWNRTGLNFETIKLSEECNYESGLIKKDGTSKPIEVHARRVEFEETDSIQWIIQDISERKELDALRDDMTAMIYHDIRSPLGNVVSSLEMMSELMPSDDALNSMLNIARNSTARIQRLVNSLLDINRLKSGQQIIDQNSVDPQALIREAIRDVLPAANGRQQTVENKLNTVLPLIWVDVDMIHRVFINLLENAIKFTPVSGQIHVGASTDGTYVKFWIRDNGPGISAADRERIFDKFIRLRGRERTVGLGLGLAFCRLAIHGHGGDIWVESEPEKGSTFWITLPVAHSRTPTGSLQRRTGRLTINSK